MIASLTQRHLFREIAGLFLLSLFSLLALILIGRLLQLRELFLGLNLNVWDLVVLFTYLSPFFLILLIPISCLLGVFLTFLRMSTDRELLAFRAGGVSLYRLLPAPLLFCLLCMLLTFWVSFFGLSWGMEHFRASVMDFARTKTQLILQPGVFNKTFPGLMVFARQVDNKVGSLNMVLIQDRTREGITATILAPRGRVRTDVEKGQILFELEQGTVYRQQDDRINVLSFDNYRVRLGLDKLLRGVNLGEVHPKEMSWTKLQELKANKEGVIASEDENFYRKVLVEQQKRVALPIACLILGLLGLPLAVFFQGLRQQVGVLLALGMFLLYYTMLSLGLSLGETGMLPPVVGLWLPNGLFLLLGAYGIRLANLERTPRLMAAAQHWRFWSRLGRSGA